MITIRAFVQPNNPRTRDYISHPAVKVTARRLSKALVRDACRAFADALRTSLPHDGARAHLEVSDRHGCRVLASYEGRVTRCNPPTGISPCAPCAGVWRLTRVCLEPGVELPAEVTA